MASVACLPGAYRRLHRRKTVSALTSRAQHRILGGAKVTRVTWLLGLAVTLVMGCGDDGTGTTAGPAGTGATGATGGSGGTGGQLACGNGVVDSGEGCDGTDLGGATCESEGFGPGTLGCIRVSVMRRPPVGTA
jgi:hypothetical protein